MSRFDQDARKLLVPNLSMESRLLLVRAVRNDLSTAHTSEYMNFLSSYFRVFSQLLTDCTEPQGTDSCEHKVRNGVLHILNRLPHNEVMKPFVQDLLKLSMHVLLADNEENGLICLQIIFHLHRDFRSALESEVQPFLDFACKGYQNFGNTVTYFFEDFALGEAQLARSQPNMGHIGKDRSHGGGPLLQQLNRSTHSFKVVNECVFIVMFMLQRYPTYVQTNMPLLLPQMVNAISITGPSQVPANLKKAVTEMIGAQVKTVSFLTYGLKMFADFIRPHEEIIANSIVNLLVKCPDSVTLRQDIWLATRQILSTDFWRGFFFHIDTLLDATVLVDTGRECDDRLRPVAYSALAELIHHVFLDLSLPQLSRVVYLFSKTIHDSSLPLRVQTTCVQQMQNLLQTIFRSRVEHDSNEEARAQLGRVLHAFVSKFSTLKHIIRQLLEGGDSEDGKERPNLRSRLELPVQSSQNLLIPPEHANEVSDCKELIKSLIVGMKTVVWSITYFNTSEEMQVSQAPDDFSPACPTGMREDEVQLACGILKSGLYCLTLFKDEDEKKEIFSHYSSVFAVMENRNLMDVFSLCMPRLFECTLGNNEMLQVCSSLLETRNVTQTFAEALVNYLVNNKLEVLNQPDLPPAKLVVELFRDLFVAVSKFPADCERVLQPHVMTVMEACVKNATEVEEPLGYLQLLRSMFQPLSGGKFELLFGEFVSTLHPCLNMLLEMLEGPIELDTTDVVVELCLTMPAMLRSLLPYLARLMKPLVLALKGSDELVALGLSTLELWIDNLDPEYLESSMGNGTSELILILWSHLRPEPYAFSSRSLQLLGKLGGRNRSFLKEPLALQSKENPEHGFRLMLTFEPTKSFLVPLDRCIFLARTAVMGTKTGVDVLHRKRALKFLRVCLSSVLNLKANVGKGVTAGQLSTMLVTSVHASMLVTSVHASGRRMEKPSAKEDLGVKTKTQFIAESNTFKVLLMTVIASSAESELRELKDDFVLNICRHFAMIFHMDSSSSSDQSVAAAGQLREGEASAGNLCEAAKLKQLDPLIFLDALVVVLADENRTHAKAALDCLNVFSETQLLLCRKYHTGFAAATMVPTSPYMSPVHGLPPGVRIPVFEQLFPRLLHCCYGGTWQTQMGGVIGLGALVGKATADTFSRFEARIVQALVYVLKRLPPHAKKEHEETSQVLTQVLRVTDNADEINNEKKKLSFQAVVEFLAAELFNLTATDTVRKTLRSCLTLLASRTGSEVSQLLEPLCPALFLPLVQSPLCSKDVDQQVGTVMALNVFLALQPPLLEISPELISVLQDALCIAEADEDVLNGMFMSLKMAVTQKKLRFVCIELLCTAMASDNFRTQSDEDLRSRIFKTFFKYLNCRSPEIVAVAKDGLLQFIQHQKMTKQLLHSILPPIFVNLDHYQKFTMPLLQGLARLLELFSNWFNVSLGEKLMNYLEMWLEPEKLAASETSSKSGEDPQIAAGIVELFHLLPSSAGRFLDSLVVLIIKLEEALPPGQVYSELNSPYRVPLTKFLNHYATEAVDYFLARLTQPKYFRRFLDIIKSEIGQTLREELSRSPGKLISSVFLHTQISLHPEEVGGAVGLFAGSISSSELSEGSSMRIPFGGGQSRTLQYPETEYQGIALLSTMVKLMPDWLWMNRAVFEALVSIWKSPARSASLRNEEGLSFIQVKESKRLVKCFLNYLRHDKNEVDFLFEMLSIFLVRTRIDYTFLKEFFMVEVAEGYTAQEKKIVLNRFLHLFQMKTLSQDLLTVAIKMLILPMLSHAFENSQSWDVVDAAIITTIVEKLLDPLEEVSAGYDESLQVELLQLVTLFLRFLPNGLVPHREELLKFGYKHLKRRGSPRKWAIVCVCHLYAAYQVPEFKHMLEIFVALLRTFQPENRVLVNESLDVLTPALSRLPLGDSKTPIWILHTRMTLLEEGHSVPNLIHIFQLLVRHSDLFYAYRALFVTPIVDSLQRLGLPQNCPDENRRLTIDLAGLIISWEKRRQAEANGPVAAGAAQNPGEGSDAKPPFSGWGAWDGGHVGDSFTETDAGPSENLRKKVKRDSGGLPSDGNGSLNTATTRSARGEITNIGAPGSPGPPDEEFQPNAAMEEVIFDVLIRVAFITETAATHSRAMEVLSQGLEVWPKANVRFNYLERSISSLTGRHPSLALAQGLEVLNKVLEKQPHFFIRENVQHIIQVLEPSFNSTLVSQQPSQQHDSETSFTSKVPDIEKFICTLLKCVFETYPVDYADSSTPEPKQQRNNTTTELKQQAITPEIKQLHVTVEELIQKNLGAVIAAQPALDIRASNSVISFTLSVLETLAETNKLYIDRFMVSLVKVLQRLAREMGTISRAVARQQGSRLDQDSAKIQVQLEFNLSMVITNLKILLKLASSRVLFVAHCKELFGEQVQEILGTKGADTSVLFVILDVIRGWVENDFKGSTEGGRNDSGIFCEDVVSFLQQLAQVDCQIMSAPLSDEWEGKYLKLLHRLCSDSAKYTPSVRKEVFQKVECVYMRGLRARDPEVRHKFFTHYDDSIGKTLFTRLQYILQTQDWAALSEVFWLKQGLDLILAILVEDEPINLAPNSALLPPLMASGRVPQSSGMQQLTSELVDKTDGAPPSFMGIVNKHARFLNEFSDLHLADLVLPLRDFAHTDAHVAYHLWVLVFPIVWQTLQKKEQKMLARPVISLLSKDYHSKQLDKRPNVVQALLEGLSVSQPQPKIPNELIKFLGKTYNAWHIAVSLLESYVMLFPLETRCFDALAELYRMLNEDDFRYALWKRRAKNADTRAGLSLVQHGFWQRAQDVFFQAIKKEAQGTYNNGSTSTAEMCLWEEQWVSCASCLNEWEPLIEFARHVDDYNIQLGCLWKNSDWATLKETVLSKAQVEESPEYRIVQAYSALKEATMTGVTAATINEAEMRVSQGIELALHQWWQLPYLAAHSHIPLLQKFQQLVELQESARVLLEMSNTPDPQQLKGQVCGPDRAYIDPTDLLVKWRLRIPNEWDEMTVWTNLLLWRNQMYNAVINPFKNSFDTNPHLHQLGLRDKAWSVNKLANVARKQGLYDVCLNVLNEMYGYMTMDANEAFVKVKEQAKAHLQMKGGLINGINFINRTNLEDFQVQHKAEITCLKGEYYQRLNDSDNANRAFSVATSLFTSSGKGWLKWGNYCYQVCKESGEESWLEYAVSCLLQGVKYLSKHGRNYLASVLYMLSFNNQTGQVGKAFDKYVDEIPLWVWLAWVPQLLLSLQRPEVASCKNVLLKLAEHFPQALFYWLRTYLWERTDETGRDVMEALWAKHSHLATQLEVMLTQIAKFIPFPEERLLAVVDALLHGCYKYQSATIAEVPNILKMELSRLCKTCFSAEMLRKHADFVSKHKRNFELDLDPDSTGTFPATLVELTKRLKHWKGVLQSDVEEGLPAVLKLEEESPQLQEFHSLDVEVPGQYLNDEDVAPDHKMKLDRFGADVPIIRRHGSSERRLTMVGSDGSKRHFVVQTSSASTTARSDERVVQLFRVLNRLLDKHKESRRRLLAFNTPIIIPVQHHLRLVEDDLMYSSLGEVYEINCARDGQDADLPITHFKERLNKAFTSQLSNDPARDAELRLHTYFEITTSFVSESVFSQYMYKTLPTFNHLWTFKKQFASQFALSGLMSYILKIGGRSPKKIRFAKNSGKVFQSDFRPAYDLNGMVEFSEPVPFRLTRNLQHFLSPFGVEGPFVSSMCAVAQAIVASNNQLLQHRLAIFFRDELISWSWLRRPGVPNATAPGGFTSTELKQKVTANVEQVMNRVKGIAPQSFPEEEENSTNPLQSVQQGVTALVEAAVKPKSLCMMDPTWHPWF